MRRGKSSAGEANTQPVKFLNEKIRRARNWENTCGHAVTCTTVPGVLLSREIPRAFPHLHDHSRPSPTLDCTTTSIRTASPPKFPRSNEYLRSVTYVHVFVRASVNRKRPLHRERHLPMIAGFRIRWSKLAARENWTSLIVSCDSDI